MYSSMWAAVAASSQVKWKAPGFLGPRSRFTMSANLLPCLLVAKYLVRYLRFTFLVVSNSIGVNIRRWLQPSACSLVVAEDSGPLSAAYPFS